MTVVFLRLLRSAAVDYRGRTLTALVLVVLAKLATVAVPLSLKAIIDTFSGTSPVLVLPVFLLLAYATLRFLGTLFGELRDLVFSRVSQSIVSGYMLRAFSHLHRLSVRFHATRHTGGVSRDVERGTTGIGFLLGVALFTILPTLIEIIAVIVVMTLNYSLWFILIILVTFLLYGMFTVSYTERRAIYQRQLNKLDSKANSRLVDSLLNYETVKYYTNEAFEQRHFSTILGRWVEVGISNQKALFVLHVGQSGLIALGVASVMLLAGQNVVAGRMTVGDLVLINAYVIQLCLPLNSLGFVFRQARDAVVNAERLFGLMETRPEIEDQPGQGQLQVTQGRVDFEHVDFGYEAGRQILWDVSFSIPPGATVAVVGGSGSGKSTLARLLFRFYDAGAGSIRIDGQDVRGVSQQSLRAAIGIVPQDTILFNDTIAYNIAYGRSGATLEEVIEVARAAHVHDFIAGLPEQYDTVVGERGVKLSGGEKQRIAIARAMLKNPPIMIFDEATSALDTRAERAIQDELNHLAAERTTLIIAHRLSTVVNADQILVLEHGHVVERGTHSELLQLDGVYAQMWQLQRQQSELEQTESGLALQPVNLIALLNGVLDELMPVIEAQGIAFDRTIAVESALIVGDPAQLQQILWQLIQRALAATPRGGRIGIRLERAGSRVWLSLVHRNTALEAEDLGDFPAILARQGARIEEALQPDGTRNVVLDFPLPALGSL